MLESMQARKRSSHGRHWSPHLLQCSCRHLFNGENASCLAVGGFIFFGVLLVL